MSLAAAAAHPLDTTHRVAASRTGAALVLAAAAFAIFHPYIGIAGDAALYLGRAQADLDPGGVGRDITFVNDGQSQFSLFFRLLDPLVSLLGPERAGLVVAFAAMVCVYAAACVLARTLTRDPRAQLAILLAVAVLPTTYGNESFHFAEASVLPRPFAEALVIGAVAALLAGRRSLVALLLLAALPIHPIMTMAGAGVVAVLLAWRRGLRACLGMVAALASAAGLALVLGRLGVPLFDRLLVRVDPDWLAMLTQRSPYLFPSLWNAAAVAAPCVHLTTLVLAAQRGDPARRRVLAAVAISTVAQMAAALSFGDGLHSLLAIQVQGWRATWLAGFMASACLPLVAIDLWGEGPRGRIVLALLGTAWFCGFGLPATAAVCVCALVLRQPWLALRLQDRHATWALAAAVTLVAICSAAALTAWIKLAASAPEAVALIRLGLVRANLLAAPLSLGLALWFLRDRHRRCSLGLAGLLSAAALVAALASWDQRAAAEIFFGRQDGFSPHTVPGGSSSEVMVFGGLTQAWFALGRPQYFSPQQASSIVFSRPLAMEYRRRKKVLRGLGLVGSGDDLAIREQVAITEPALAAFCRRADAPAAVIVPDLADSPAPALPGAARWTPPSPRPFVESFEPLRVHVVRGWSVAACAELAKSGAR